MGKFSELSECELTTMKCIWDAKDPITAAEVMDQLKEVYGLTYKDTTVYTFIKKLKDKGFVDSYRKGLTYFFPVRDEKEYRDSQLNRLKSFWFEDSASKFTAAVLELGATEEEKDQIKSLL